MEQLAQYNVLYASLQELKAFDIRNGSITLHFDALGRIKAVEKKEMVHIV